MIGVVDLNEWVFSSLIFQSLENVAKSHSVDLIEEIQLGQTKSGCSLINDLIVSSQFSCSEFKSINRLGLKEPHARRENLLFSTLSVNFCIAS